MKIVVIGNGAVGLMAAREFLARDPSTRIVIVAPAARPGCASVAAAAMLNSFAEVDIGTMQHFYEKQKWLFNRAAVELWPEMLPELEEEADRKICFDFGTYVINNHISDSLEDENFDAVVSALNEFDEPYENIDPRSIPFYKPSSPSRAGRCVYIPREGFVNPLHLIDALDRSLRRSGRVEFIDGWCDSLHCGASGKIEHLTLSDGSSVGGDAFFLSPGANFSQIIDASNLGMQFPRVFYGAGCTVVLNTKENTLSKCIRTPNRGLACGIYSAPRDAEHTIVGASNFIAPYPISDAFVGSVYNLLKSAMEQINSDYYRSNLVLVNMGWRPTSEDTLPMLGQTDISNLLVATATKRDGLHCSPLIARCMADLLFNNRSPYDLSHFKPDRQPVKVMSRSDSVNMFVRHSMNANYQHDFVPAKSRMLEEMERMYRNEIEELHDSVEAFDYGIPPELVNMYRYGHIPRAQPKKKGSTLLNNESRNSPA